MCCYVYQLGICSRLALFDVLSFKPVLFADSAVGGFRPESIRAVRGVRCAHQSGRLVHTQPALSAVRSSSRSIYPHAHCAVL